MNSSPSLSRRSSSLANAPRAQRFALSIRAVVGRSHVSHLRGHVAHAHSMVKPALRELSIAIVGDTEMARLHQRFMHVAGPTDVLTFVLDAGDEGLPIAGEVVVCLDEAKRAAAEHGTRVRDELLLYCVHGLLHLCGFDDTTRDAFDRMHAMEDRLLNRLGVGPVFRPASRQSNVARRKPRTLTGGSR